MEKDIVTSPQDSFSNTCSAVTNGIISFFLLILVTVFPLVFHNSYFDILETKYMCFYLIVLIMLGILLLAGLIMLFIDLKEFQGEHAKKLFCMLEPKYWKSTFSIADAAVFIFWLASVISTFQSEYFYESFWGNEGRYSGLFLMTLYVILYFTVSHFWHMKPWLFQCFLAASLVVCLIGISDAFYMDLLHFRTHMKQDQFVIFVSTIGNINSYTAYVSVFMGLATAMFVAAKDIRSSSWYYLCMTISFFAIILGSSDNAYLALGALFAFLPLIAFRRKSGIVRYFITLATFAAVIQCIDIICQTIPDKVSGPESLFKILVNLPGLPLLVLGLWILSGILWYLFSKKDDTLCSAETCFLRTWKILIGLGFLVVFLLLFDANVLGHNTRYGSLSNYLVFNDQWGTNRGFIWRKSLELFSQFPLSHKLFGFGPDTFGILTTKSTFKEMIAATGQVFDTAHNEYLQYLLTIGPIALAAYLVFLINSCQHMSRLAIKNLTTEHQDAQNSAFPYAAGCLFAVICYCFQAFVNLNLPIITPFLWLSLSMGIATVKKYQSQEDFVNQS